jgi:energy-coupling factor transporter ATP-binding protein EcfA2
MREIIAGPNFSGRSVMLMTRLRARVPSGTFFVGPYAEAALSGLASTVSDEIAIYHAPNARPVFAPLDFADLAARKPPTLSGGEQVLLALHCFSQSKFGVIGIDTALEQLDAQNRRDALAYLAGDDFDTLLIDNRIDGMPGWSRIAASDAGTFACDLSAFGAHHRTQAPAITIENLSFRYRAGRDIFRNLDLTLLPGHAYRLTGPNGAGKTTLFKLLAGVLVPASGRIALDGKSYAPWRGGNRVFAYATQNPDHQWCGATLAEDLARRRAAVAGSGIAAPADADLLALANRLGIDSLDQHLYELPLAARKRLTWLWPLSGVLPWIMLDEPTVGQDGATRAALAAALTRLCALGHGIVFITHDDAFADAVAHRRLLIDGAQIITRHQPA